MENTIQSKVDLCISELIIPIEKSSQMKEKTVEKKLYSGYIIANIKKTNSLANAVLKSKCVNTLMGIPLKKSDICKIKQNLKKNAKTGNSRFSFCIGENVNIVNGPFETFNG